MPLELIEAESGIVCLESDNPSDRAVVFHREFITTWGERILEHEGTLMIHEPTPEASCLGCTPGTVRQKRLSGRRCTLLNRRCPAQLGLTRLTAYRFEVPWIMLSLFEATNHSSAHEKADYLAEFLSRSFGDLFPAFYLQEKSCQPVVALKKSCNASQPASSQTAASFSASDVKITVDPTPQETTHGADRSDPRGSGSPVAPPVRE